MAVATSTPPGRTGNTHTASSVDHLESMAAIIGLSFYWPFMRNSINGFLVACNSPIDGNIISFSLLAIGTSILLSLALLAGRPLWESIMRNRTGRICLSAFAIATSLLNSAVYAASALGSPSLALFATAMVSVECFFVVMSVCWMDWAVDRPGEFIRKMHILAWSFVLSFLIGFLSYLPAPWDLVRPLLGPAITGLCWLLCSRRKAASCLVRGARDSDLPLAHDDAPRLSGSNGDYGQGHAHGLVPAGLFDKTTWILYCASFVAILVGVFVNNWMNPEPFVYAPSETTLVRDVVTLAVALAILAGSYVITKVERLFFFAFSLLIGLLAIGFVLTALLPVGLRDFGKGLVFECTPCLMLVLYAALAHALSQRGTETVSPTLVLFTIPVLASMLATNAAIVCLGGPAEMGLDGSPQPVMLLALGFATCLLLVVTLYVIVLSLMPSREMALRDEAAQSEPGPRSALSPASSGRNFTPADSPLPAASSPYDPTTPMSPNTKDADRRVVDVSRRYQLSEREADVLGLLLQGYTYKGIASALFMSLSTAQTHAKGIYRKCGVHSKQELISLVEAESEA